MINPEDLTEVIEVIYDAALAPEGWTAALKRVAGFVGGPTAMLFWIDSVLARGGRFYSWGDDPAFTKSYFEKYIQIDPLRKVQHLLPVGQVVAVSTIVGPDRIHQGQFYEEWMRPQGYVDNVLTNVDRSIASYASVAVARDAHHGMVDAPARRRMALIAPHIRRAVLISKLVDLRQNEVEAWGRLLDGIDAGIFLLDSEAKVIQSNHLAEAMIKRSDVVTVADGHLITLDHSRERDFMEFLQLAVLSDARLGDQGISLPLAGLDAEHHVAHFLPLRSKGQRPGFDHPSAKAAIFIRRLALDTSSGLHLIVLRFELTPRETEVLQAIVEVRGPAEVAALLGISTRTAKAHLQSVFNKTGTNRQADLIKLVAGFSTHV